MADLAAFPLASATLLLLPGPTNALLATASARAGHRAALALLPVVLAAYAATIGAVILMVAAGAEASPVTGPAIRVIAAVYLAWLGVRLWRRAGSGPARGDGLVRGGEIFLATLLNPKGFILALLLPVGGGLAGLVAHAAILAAAIVASGFAWVSAGHALARAAPRLVAGGLVDRAGAAVIVAFAIYFSATALAALVPG